MRHAADARLAPPCFPLWITGVRARLGDYNSCFRRATSPHMRADLWQRGCERLASELPDQQFNTWIRPLPDADVADNGERRRGHRARPEPLQARLDSHPVRRPDRDRAERARRQAGPARRHARASATARARGDAHGIEPSRRPRRAAQGGAAVAKAANGHATAKARANGSGASSTALAGARRAALAQPAQSGADLRHAGSRPRQPDGAHGGAARRRLARPHVQPALHLRRRRPRQDAPDPRRRQRAPRRSARRAHPLSARRAVHHRRGEELPEEDLRRAEGEVPLARPAADRRRPVLRRQGAHAGGVLQRLRGAARQARAHHHDERHLSERTGRHRRAPDLALRRRAHGRDRAARARDAGRDPDEEGRPGSDADARGRRLLRRQERSRQRARARGGAAEDPRLLALLPQGNQHPASRARR